MCDNSINIFLKKENLKTLWDVLSEVDIFKFLSKNKQNKISEIFSNNIQSFYENEKEKNINLLDLNKKYILLILNYIRVNFSEISPNKIKILNEETSNNDLITYEEIHNEKISKFEHNLKIKQEEFNNAIKLKIPETPNFSEKIDEPISEMDKMIEEIQAKRNYDILTILNNSKSENDNSWLKSEETSLKSEKMQMNNNNSNNNNNNSNNNNNNNNNKENKHIQWADEINETSEDVFFLNKFKKINTSSEENNILENKIKNLENKFDLLFSKVEKILEILNV
jgi:hypothetical protein